jgi:hypothetical protein
LDTVMDGRFDREGCGSGEEKCDVCQQASQDNGFVMDDDEMAEFATQQAQHQWTNARLSTQRQQDAQLVEELQAQLEFWSGSCPLCRVLYRSRSRTYHNLGECTESGSRYAQEHMEQLRREIRYEPFASCHHCHIPQAICQHWEQMEEKGWWQERTQDCQYGNIVMEVVIVLLREGEKETIRQVVSQMDGEGRNGDGKAVLKWLGQKMTWAGIEISRLVWVFYQLSKSYEGRG